MTAVNQCDGCRAGHPLVDGVHKPVGSEPRDGSWMRCTADRYGVEPFDGCEPTFDTVLRQAEGALKHVGQHRSRPLVREGARSYEAPGSDEPSDNEIAGLLVTARHWLQPGKPVLPPDIGFRYRALVALDNRVADLKGRLAARDAERDELIELVRSVGAAKGLGWRDIAIAKLLRHVENKHGRTP